MKKGIVLLLAVVMSFGAMVATFALDDDAITGAGPRHTDHSSMPLQVGTTSVTAGTGDPVMAYLRTLDAARPPSPGVLNHGGQTREASSPLSDYQGTGAVMLYEDPENEGEWLPMPSWLEIQAGLDRPVSFCNGTRLEVHGKLFDVFWVVDQNLTYMDDIGIPDAPIEVEFDSIPVAVHPDRTGNSTTMIEPFTGTGNGTFSFILDLIRPAGEYEVMLHFAGWPPDDPKDPLTYKVPIFVSHPVELTWDVAPDPVTVGDPINVSGSVADDTGRPVTSGPLQVWFDDQLMGPTSDGVYIDDVFVGGVDFSDTFDTAGSPGWTTYSAPGVIADNQWEHGSPHNPIGPMAPHSSWGLWGTDIDGDYQRGAWSFLVSPTMDFSEDVTYNLTFWAWWNVYWEDDFAYVLASDDGGATWDEENAMVFMGSSLSHLYWSRFDFNLTAYQGSDDVRLAFVFYSVPKTLNVRHDATFRFSGLVSMTTKAGPRTITVVFEGNLFFQGLAEETELGVRQRAEFSFPPFARDKIGYRNKEITINASLVDSTGAIVDNQLTGEPEVFKVHIHWDPTWTIEDGKGEAVGPPVTVGEGGEVRANYTVPWDHVLGPARVTFAFLGGTYYEPVEQTDIYYVKAETYFLAPPSQYRITFRGQPVEITADLRIVIDQSIDKLEPGDPLSGEFVKVFWNGDQIGNRRTTFEGSFSIDYLVPSTFELGAVNVTFEYEGQSLYEPMTTSFEYRVVSETSMVFVDREVYKGTWVQMFGSLHDDKAQPLVGVQVSLDWRGGSQVLTTDAEGEFSFDHFVEFGDKVGNVTVTAKFGGNNLYLASSVSATYTYKIGTVLVRQDHVRTAMRGEQIQVSARLYEQWGDLRGVEVQREVVTLLIDDMVVSYKRTAFDGSVTFTAPMEVDKFPYGEVNLTLVFTGTEFLEPAMNVTPLVIRARAVLTYAELRVNGELFNQIDERVHYQDEVYGRVLLQDSNFQPIPYQTVAAYYKEADPRATKRIIQSSQTDSQGYFEFDWTFVNRYNGRMSLIVEFAGTREATTYDPDAIIVEPVTSYYNFTYDSPGVEPHDFEVDTDGDRRVAPGAELVLLVILQDPGDWNPGTLNYSLVDPPAGMTITSDGIIKWTPGEGDEGDHTITVRIYDGDRTETAKIKITVGEEGSAREETRVIVAFIAAGLIIAIVVIIGLVMMFRDRE